MTENHSMQPKHGESIFWVEIEKIKPNPMQPRRAFDPEKLKELSDSIRAYGILQPLVVVRQEMEVPSGTNVEYELIAGERRLRAAKLADIKQIPVIIRDEPPERVKLELAIVENVQREDLSPLDRAAAFKQLMEEFHLKQREIADRIGKSREFIANSIRLLSLPDNIKQALIEGKITEGHTRPLLMLSDRPVEQQKMLEDITYKHLNVREAEQLARRIAYDRARKKDDLPDPQTRELEEMFSQAFGTRVAIERKGLGGRISIDFFSPDDLREILNKVAKDSGNGIVNVEKNPENIEDIKNDYQDMPNTDNEVKKEETSVNESFASDDDLKTFTI